MSLERFSVLRRISADRLVFASLTVLVGLLLVSLLAPLLPLADPNQTHLTERLAAPLSPAALASGQWLGSDELGRDMLSRLLHAVRLSVGVALAGVLAAAVTGTLVGVVAGFYAGVLDSVLMRLTDVLLAFPYLLLALAVVAVLGPGLNNATLAIALVNVPFFARTIRGQVLSLKRETFVDAARGAGLSRVAIVTTELLPSLLPTVVVMASTSLGWMVLETAGLSFLGLGAVPPTADLGSMLGRGRHLLGTAPHVSLLPGGLIFVLVALFNVVGDGCRDALDPRQVSARAGSGSTRKQTRTEVSLASDHAQQPGDRSPVLLRVHQLSVQFGDAVAVRDVSFEIRRGEKVALVGESGSGKSQTALAVLRLLEPDAQVATGSIWFDGTDLHTLDERQMCALRGKRVAWVPQDPMSSLHPLRRIGAQLTEALMMHGKVASAQAKSEALQLLADVGIADPQARFRAWPHQLSGGMRQRVVIAMALAGKPELLIADEPTTALDVTTQANVLSLIRQLCDDLGVGLLFISHDLSVVSQLCERVLVMRRGAVVESGSVESLIRAPQHEYTQHLVASIPILGSPERILDSAGRL